MGTVFLQIRAYEDRQQRPPTDVVVTPGQGLTSPVKVRRPRHSSIGTAFIIGDGVWITARHVIEGCETVEVNHPRAGWSSFVSLESHKKTDIAYVRTPAAIHNTRRFESIAFALASPEVGDIGYVHGFPQGVEADREQQFIGSDWVSIKVTLVVTSGMFGLAEVLADYLFASIGEVRVGDQFSMIQDN